MLFGHRRVGEVIHLGSTFLVAFGTMLSAFWILALNSWMQTPAGYEIIDGQFQAKNWLEIIFNPSFPYRFVHMMLASALTCFPADRDQRLAAPERCRDRQCIARAADRAHLRRLGYTSANSGG